MEPDEERTVDRVERRRPPKRVSWMLLVLGGVTLLAANELLLFLVDDSGFSPVVAFALRVAVLTALLFFAAMGLSRLPGRGNDDE